MSQFTIAFVFTGNTLPVLKLNSFINSSIQTDKLEQFSTFTSQVMWILFHDNKNGIIVFFSLSISWAFQPMITS